MRSSAWAETDPGAIRRNALEIRRRCPGAALAAVVKRDAYGHGAVAAARALQGVADLLAVADGSEAAALRAAGVRATILVLGPAAAAGMRPPPGGLASICGPDDLPAAGPIRGGALAAHLKVDTGMGRLGVWWREAAAFATKLSRAGVRRLAGTYTHLADAADRRFTDMQLDRFDAALAALRRAGVSPGLTHAANSEAVLANPRARRYGAVRPGLLLYGCLPGPRPAPPPFRPALAVRCRVLAVRNAARGDTVSYGRTWRAPRPARLAVLPLGYADGLSRALSGRGAALVRGRRAPFRGRVCMNFVVVEVTKIPGVRPGDVATLLGSQGRGTIRAEAVAAASGTIAYEPLCALGRLLPRRILGGGRRPRR